MYRVNAARGEFALINRHFNRGPARRAWLGVGDDCALLPAGGDEALAVSTDMLVAGRHFFEDADPVALGHKALAVNLSDLAAMGARPLAFTLGLALPEVDDPWLASLCQGMFALADRYDCELVGGDTTRGPLNLCVTVFGNVPRAQALRRDAARAGDDIWVSGALGAAAFAVSRRQSGAALADDHPAQDRLDRPQPRVELGLALRGVARAAIDLSDGLAGDLAHIMDRSGVGARLRWSEVPVAAALNELPLRERMQLALAGGDDYELLFTAAFEQRAKLQTVAQELGLALTRIGQIVTVPGLVIEDDGGVALPWSGHGFDHFA